MTDKEKLEKALVHLKKFIDGDCVITQEILADFPELEDSEDERIRKAIVKTIKESPVIGVGEFSKNDMLAYLEKQKENTEELVYRLNRLMQEYINERKDEAEQEHRFKCYKLFWDALEDASYFDEQKEPKPISFNESYNPDDYEVVMKGLHKNSLRKGEPNKWIEEDTTEEISREEQIALSIMAYLDTHIKNDKNLVLRGVTLQDAREWIRKQIKNGQLVCEGLEEAARLFAIPHYMKDIDKEHIEEYPYDMMVETAFKAGAKWQAEQDKETIELAEDHAYLAGAVNEREKIMKEAVEGEVENASFGIVYLRKNLINEGYSTGDKVKLIFIKED